jgi:hypothetical protein
MSDQLRIFVGATADLEAERAVVGRSVAELPVKIGIEIRRTPPLLPTTEEIINGLDGVDRVYFLMGNDITAPAGLEWHLARQWQRAILPLRNSPRPTPAAIEFFRLTPVAWQDFHNQAQLARLVSLDLVRLLQGADNRFGLTVMDMERVAAYMRRLEAKSVEKVRDPGGAEGGAVLLDASNKNSRR